MKLSRYLFLLLCPLLLNGCRQSAQKEVMPLTSMNIVDQNGFMETISSKERLAQFKNTNFLHPQPYKKVMRVYARDHEGKARSFLTSYHPNGQLKQYLEIVNGRAFGKYQEWHEDGVLKLDTTVIGGKADLDTLAADSWLFDGLNRAWNQHGQLIAQVYYNKGQLHGTATHYYPNGKIRKSLPYEKGKLEGMAEQFFENGDLQLQAHYREGLNDGVSKRFWDPTHIAVDETYRKGTLEAGAYYDHEGHLIASVSGSMGFQMLFADDDSYQLREIQAGVPEGRVKEFDKEGRLLREFVIKGQFKEGEEVLYSQQSPKLSIHWHRGAIQGLVKTWYEDGTLESQREMSHNKKNGVSMAWYRDGTLMLMEEYQDDKLSKGEYFQKGSSLPISKVVSGKGLATLYDGGGEFLKKVRYEDGFPDD